MKRSLRRGAKRLHGRTPAMVGALLAMAWLSGCAVDVDTELSLAEAQFASGDLDAAMQHADNALRGDAEHGPTRLLRGRVFLAIGDFERARDDLRRAVAAGVDAALPLADALLQLGENDQALSLLEAVPDSAHQAGYSALYSEALMAAGRVDEAATVLRTADESSRSLLARARLASLRGDRDGAERFASAAIEAAQTRHEALNARIARGERRLSEQRFAEAADDLRRAAELSARDPISAREVGVLALLVQVNIARNELGEAGEWARTLAARAPDALATSYTTALVAYEDGRYDDAVALLQRATSQTPGNRLFATLLAAAHLGRGDVYQAERQLMGVLAEARDDPAAIKLLAEARLRQQRPRAALDALQPLVGAGADPQIDALQGIASLQAGDTERAVAYLEQAVAGDPVNQAMRLELARAYLAAGRSEQARALLESVSAADATVAERTMLLLTQVRADDAESARARIEEVLRAYPTEASTHMAAAAAYQMLGDRERAVTVLENAVRMDASFVQPRLVLAGLLNDAGRASEAERLLEEALALEPENALALAGLAQLALARGAAETAEPLLERAVAAAPTLPVRLMLARVLLRQGDAETAAVHIEAAAAQNADDPEVALLRGLHALATDSPARALEYLGKARDSLPARLDVALALAQAQGAVGDTRASRDTLESVVRAAPDWVPGNVALGVAQLEFGDAAAALRIAKDLQVRLSQQPHGYLLEGRIRMAQRRYADAAVYHGLAYDRARTWNLLLQWITALRLAEEPTRVESELKAWISAHPEHVAARLVLADHLQQAGGRDAEALTEYERVLTLAPDNVVALNNAAWLQHVGSNPAALGLARRARDLAPDSPAVLDTLGWILARQGDAAEGLGHLERAARALPTVGEIQYHYGYVLAELGRPAEARAVLERALREPEAFPSRREAEALLGSLR